MNNVQKLIKCRKIEKKRPKHFHGQCPICGEDVMMSFSLGQSYGYDEKKDIFEAYLECDECTAQFAVVLNVTEVYIENISDKDGKKVLWSAPIKK